MMPKTATTRAITLSMLETPCTRNPVGAPSVTPMMPETVSRPEARPVMMPVPSPTVTALKMSRVSSATVSMSATGMSITRARGLEACSSSCWECAELVAWPEAPSRKNPMAAKPAVVKAKRARLRTTPAMSAVPALRRNVCVDDEMTVVSEIGATLSPKIAPEMIAAARRAGWAPRSTPAG